MERSLSLKTRQTLALSPRLQQSVRLLQLSALEFAQEIRQALVTNPFLEEEETEETPPTGIAAPHDETTTVEAPPGRGLRTGARLLDGSGRYRVTVRVSKATPTPRGWPDVFGLAIRWAGVDLLLSSSNRRPLLRHLFLPRRHQEVNLGRLPVL